jgi:DNA-binding Lrp family transcriptional regulator
MTTNEDTFSIDELLIALQSAQSTPTGTRDGMRAEDLARLTGMSKEQTYKRLKELKAAGRIEVVMVSYERVDDIQTRVRGYRLVQHE